MAQDVINITLTGDKKLDKIFLELDKKIRKNAVRKGVRRANKVFREQGKRNAPKGTGRLKKSIKSKVSTKFDIVRGVTGVDAGPGAKNDAWYANFVEYGTKSRSTTHKIFNIWSTANVRWLRSDKRNKVAPTDLKSFPRTMFMTRTFDQNWRKAVKKLQKEITLEVFKARGASSVVLEVFQ